MDFAQNHRQAIAAHTAALRFASEVRQLAREETAHEYCHQISHSARCAEEASKSCISFANLVKESAPTSKEATQVQDLAEEAMRNAREATEIAKQLQDRSQTSLAHNIPNHPLPSAISRIEPRNSFSNPLRSNNNNIHSHSHQSQQKSDLFEPFSLAKIVQDAISYHLTMKETQGAGLSELNLLKSKLEKSSSTHFNGNPISTAIIERESSRVGHLLVESIVSISRKLEVEKVRAEALSDSLAAEKKQHALIREVKTPRRSSVASVDKPSPDLSELTTVARDILDHLHSILGTRSDGIATLEEILQRIQYLVRSISEKRKQPNNNDGGSDSVIVVETTDENDDAKSGISSHPFPPPRSMLLMLTTENGEDIEEEEKHISKHPSSVSGASIGKKSMDDFRAEETWRRKISDLERQLRESTWEQESLRSEMEELRKQLSNKSETIQKMNAQLDNSRLQIAQYENEIRTAELMFDVAEDPLPSVEELRAVLESARRVAVHQTERAAELEQKLQLFTIMKGEDNNKENVQEENKKIKEEEQQRAVAAKEQQELKKRLDEEREKVRHLANHNFVLEQQTSELYVRISQMGEEIEELLLQQQQQQKRDIAVDAVAAPVVDQVSTSTQTTSEVVIREDSNEDNNDQQHENEQQQQFPPAPVFDSSERLHVVAEEDEEEDEDEEEEFSSPPPKIKQQQQQQQQQSTPKEEIPPPKKQEQTDVSASPQSASFLHDVQVSTLQRNVAFAEERAHLLEIALQRCRTELSAATSAQLKAEQRFRELESLAERSEILNRQLVSAQSTLEAEREQRQQAEARASVLNDSVINARNQLSSLASLQIEVERLRGDIESCRSTESHLRALLASERDKAIKYSREVESLRDPSRTSLREVESGLAVANQRIRELQDELHTSEACREQSEEALVAVKNKLRQMEERANQAEERAKVAEKRATQMEEQAFMAKQLAEEIEAELNAHTNALKRSAQELDQLRRELEGTQSECRLAKVESNQAKERLLVLERAVSDARDFADRIRETESALHRELEVSRSEMEAALAARRAAENRVAELASQLRELRVHAAGLEAKCSLMLASGGGGQERGSFGQKEEGENAGLLPPRLSRAIDEIFALESKLKQAYHNRNSPGDEERGRSKRKKRQVSSEEEDEVVVSNDSDSEEEEEAERRRRKRQGRKQDKKEKKKTTIADVSVQVSNNDDVTDEREWDELNQLVAQLKADLDASLQSQVESEKKNAQLETDVEELRHQCLSGEQKQKEVKTKWTTTKQELDNVRSDLASAKKEYHALELAIISNRAEMEKEQKRVCIERDSLKERIVVFEDKQKELAKEKAELDAQVKNLQRENDRLKHSVDSLEESQKQMEHKLELASQELAKVEKDRFASGSELRAELSSVRSDMRNLQEQYEEGLTAKRKLEKQLEQAKYECSQLVLQIIPLALDVERRALENSREYRIYLLSLSVSRASMTEFMTGSLKNVAQLLESMQLRVHNAANTEKSKRKEQVAEISRLKDSIAKLEQQQHQQQEEKTAKESNEKSTFFSFQEKTPSAFMKSPREEEEREALLRKQRELKEDEEFKKKQHQHHLENVAILKRDVQNCLETVTHLSSLWNETDNDTWKKSIQQLSLASKGNKNDHADDFPPEVHDVFRQIEEMENLHCAELDKYSTASQAVQDAEETRKFVLLMKESVDHLMQMVYNGIDSTEFILQCARIGKNVLEKVEASNHFLSGLSHWIQISTAVSGRDAASIETIKDCASTVDLTLMDIRGVVEELENSATEKRAEIDRAISVKTLKVEEASRAAIEASKKTREKADQTLKKLKEEGVGAACEQLSLAVESSQTSYEFVQKVLDLAKDAAAAISESSTSAWHLTKVLLNVQDAIRDARGAALEVKQAAQIVAASEMLTATQKMPLEATKDRRGSEARLSLSGGEESQVLSLMDNSSPTGTSVASWTKPGGNNSNSNFEMKNSDIVDSDGEDIRVKFFSSDPPVLVQMSADCFHSSSSDEEEENRSRSFRSRRGSSRGSSPTGSVSRRRNYRGQAVKITPTVESGGGGGGGGGGGKRTALPIEISPAEMAPMLSSADQPSPATSGTTTTSSSRRFRSSPPKLELEKNGISPATKLPSAPSSLISSNEKEKKDGVVEEEKKSVVSSNSGKGGGAMALPVAADKSSTSTPLSPSVKSSGMLVVQLEDADVWEEDDSSESDNEKRKGRGTAATGGGRPFATKNIPVRSPRSSTTTSSSGSSGNIKVNKLPSPTASSSSRFGNDVFGEKTNSSEQQQQQQQFEQVEGFSVTVLSSSPEKNKKETMSPKSKSSSTGEEQQLQMKIVNAPTIKLAPYGDDGDVDDSDEEDDWNDVVNDDRDPIRSYVNAVETNTKGIIHQFETKKTGGSSTNSSTGFAPKKPSGLSLTIEPNLNAGVVRENSSSSGKSPRDSKFPSSNNNIAVHPSTTPPSSTSSSIFDSERFHQHLSSPPPLSHENRKGTTAAEEAAIVTTFDARSGAEEMFPPTPTVLPQELSSPTSKIVQEIPCVVRSRGSSSLKSDTFAKVSVVDEHNVDDDDEDDDSSEEEAKDPRKWVKTTEIRRSSVNSGLSASGGGSSHNLEAGGGGGGGGGMQQWGDLARKSTVLSFTEDAEEAAASFFSSTVVPMPRRNTSDESIGGTTTATTAGTLNVGGGAISFLGSSAFGGAGGGAAAGGLPPLHPRNNSLESLEVTKLNASASNNNTTFRGFANRSRGSNGSLVADGEGEKPKIVVPPPSSSSLLPISRNLNNNAVATPSPDHRLSMWNMNEEDDVSDTWGDSLNESSLSPAKPFEKPMMIRIKTKDSLTPPSAAAHPSEHQYFSNQQQQQQQNLLRGNSMHRDPIISTLFSQIEKFVAEAEEARDAAQKSCHQCGSNVHEDPAVIAELCEQIDSYAVRAEHSAEQANKLMKQALELTAISPSSSSPLSPSTTTELGRLQLLVTQCQEAADDAANFAEAAKKMQEIQQGTPRPKSNVGVVVVSNHSTIATDLVKTLLSRPTIRIVRLLYLPSSAPTMDFEYNKEKVELVEVQPSRPAQCFKAFTDMDVFVSAVELKDPTFTSLVDSFAGVAKEQGCELMILLSKAPTVKMFGFATKNDVEEKVAALGFSHLCILQPMAVVAPESQSIRERLARAISSLTYNQVALVLAHLVEKNDIGKCDRMEHKAILDLAVQLAPK